MFTGKAVTIRKDADTEPQRNFRLRSSAPVRACAFCRLTIERGSEAPKPVEPEAEGAFRLAPVGSPMVEPRAAPAAPALDISRLSLAAPGAALGTPRPAGAVAPDVSHLTVAAAGVDLGGARRGRRRPSNRPPGRSRMQGRSDDGLADVEPPVDLDEIDFELAPAGAFWWTPMKPPPAPPDTSHLRLV